MEPRRTRTRRRRPGAKHSLQAPAGTSSDLSVSTIRDPSAQAEQRGSELAGKGSARTPVGTKSSELSLSAIADFCSETELPGSELAAKVLKLLPKKSQHSADSLWNIIANLDCVQDRHGGRTREVPWGSISAVFRHVFPSVDVEEIIRQHAGSSLAETSDTDVSPAAIRFLHTRDRQRHTSSNSSSPPRPSESNPLKRRRQKMKVGRSKTIPPDRSSSSKEEQRSSPQRSSRLHASKAAGQRKAKAGVVPLGHSRALHGVSDSTGKQSRNSDSSPRNLALDEQAAIRQKRRLPSKRSDRCSESLGAGAANNTRVSRSLRKHSSGSSLHQNLEHCENPVDEHLSQQCAKRLGSSQKGRSPFPPTHEREATFMALPFFRRYPVVELERLTFLGTSPKKTSTEEVPTRKKPVETASKKEVPSLPSCLSSSPHSNRKTMLAKAGEHGDASAGDEHSSGSKTVPLSSTPQRTKRAVFVSSEDVMLTDRSSSPTDPAEGSTNAKNPAAVVQGAFAKEKKGQLTKQRDAQAVGEGIEISGSKSLTKSALNDRTVGSPKVNSGKNSNPPGTCRENASAGHELSRQSTNPIKSKIKKRRSPEELPQSQSIPAEATTAQNREPVRGSNIPEKTPKTSPHGGLSSSSSASSFVSAGTSNSVLRAQSSVNPWSKGSKRMWFTPLQEEALVYGVMRHGIGGWKYIADEGWFDGRVSRELSDKYRNLKKYGHLCEVRERVKAKLKQGTNPMKELQEHNRSIYNTRRVTDHSAQPRILPSQRVKAASKVRDVPCGGSRDSGLGDRVQDDSAKDLSQHSSAVRCDARMDAPECLQTRDEVPTGIRRDAGATVASQPSASLSREHRKDHEPGPDLPHNAECEGVRRESDERTDEALLSVPVVHLQDSPLNSDTEVSSDDSWTTKPVKPVPKKRRQNNFFTPLEEDALVSGVLKYGRGRWSQILNEGWFSGRSGIQLSDKYRNMVMYGHWERRKKDVEKKLGTPDDPLLQLKELNKAHWRSKQ